MADEIEEWRRLYRRHLADDAPPADDELVDLVAGEVRGEERARLADRVVASRRGSEDYRLLAELHKEARPAARSRRTAARLVAIAAVVMMAMGLVLWLGDRDAPPAVTRSGAPVTVTVEPADESVLTAAPRSFAWPSQPGAAAYRVELRDARAELLWRSPEISPETPRLEVPATVGARLRAGEAYFWVVRVDAGARPALGPFWFHLAEPAP